MPTEAWKMKTFKEPWFAGETLSVAIGQGATVATPLQMALAYSAIGNGGLVYQPYLVSKIVGPDGLVKKEFKPKLLRKRDSSARLIDTVRLGVFKVINEPGGTAYRYARMSDLQIAGKSGTVQTYTKSKQELFTKCDQMPFHKRNHAWFVAFAPYENPEIAVAAFGMHECAGSLVTAPIVKAVIQKWWDKKKYLESIQGPQPATAGPSQAGSL
jgi:penicillin-binding protein 2